MRLALAGKSWCEIDPQELQRGAVSYTIETVRDYARRFPKAQLFYVIGQDNLPQLPKWREAAELARLTQFAVYPRPLGPECAAGPDAADWKAGAATAMMAPAAPPRFPEPFHGRMLAGCALGVSSRHIRARVKAGLSIDPLVPAAVAEAIRNNGLYL